jgi:hypothetical protein
MKHHRFSSFATFRHWLHAHRPLAWVEALLPDYDAWSPDPPVIERLIR